ncbi:hypothetical protein EUCA11A_09020 [Eubacterium callanderi]|uniref:MrcB family domain-containing protein n=1 Tax=Eubacterium callanderi TaxID=53442 RepID=UPI0029FF3DF4|nr:DUF3578 domain-containing protein [Eubacterium callanderi]WPK66751.1 hypothetical protein EUCA2A_09020 [Eubacterium callanderi]WPK71049.1 hypothetical protein EUCA11A_09020 [Eubacterium callanderi]
MIERNFGPNDAWKMLNDYTVTFITDQFVFRDGGMTIPAELNKFFGAESGETRVVFLFEGREFPSYIECGFGENSVNNIKLTWSKALSSKFIGLFPDYENFFANMTENQMEERPILQFEKLEADEFLVKMILPTDEALTKKQELFDYLGPGKTVVSFKSSYEMVFLKNYLEQADNRGKADVFMVSAGVKKFYEARETQRKSQDKNADKTIENVKEAGLDDVLAFLMDGPYALMAEKGFLVMETIDEHFYFALEVSMLDELSTDDKRLIIELLDQKIEHYFERMDGPGLQENLTSLMDEYGHYFTRDFRYSFKDILTDGIPGCIEALKFVDGDRYKVTGFAGVEEWTEIPWVAILDRSITRVPNTGVFVQYLLNKDTQKLYLTLFHGFKEIEEEALKTGQEDVKPVVAAALRPLVAEIQRRVDPRGFDTGSKDVDLYDDRFRESVIFYREYDRMVPGDTQLEQDLQEMLEVYNDYYERCILNLYPEEEEPEEPEAPEVHDEEVSEIDGAAEEPVTEAEAEVHEMEAAEIIEPENEERSVPEIIEWEPVEEAAEPVAETQPEHMASAPEPDQPEPASVAEQPVAEVSNEAPRKAARSISEAAYLETKRVMEESSAETEEVNAVERILERVENLVEEPVDIPGTLRQVGGYITAHGFTCTPGIVENLYLCLKAKPFVILTGIAGIGKSSLARLFAEAMGVNTENGRYKQVPVRPDWKDSRGLLGYLDSSGRFVPGALNDFIKEAVDNPRKPYFLCLDEMNLARVEYYFSEILSVMETRRDREGRTVTDPLLGDEAFGRDELARERYGELYLPENLYIIGTVSSEETAFSLSRKVLDRASLIEIGQVSLYLQSPPRTMPEPIHLGNRFLKSDVLVLANCTRQRDMIQEVVTLLEAMNGILMKANAQIGYRVRDEICFYLLYNAEYGLMSQEDGLDHAILQKILPRIQGGGSAVESVLTDLFKICAGTRSGNAVRNYAGNRGGLFPKSAEKLSAMVKRFDQEGKTSFWS